MRLAAVVRGFIVASSLAVATAGCGPGGSGKGGGAAQGGGGAGGAGTGGSGGAAPTDAAPSDASGDGVAARCDPTAPFGTPVPLNVDTQENDDALSLSPDGLVIYFSSSSLNSANADVYDIYTATRSSTSQPFGQATAIGEVNTASSQDQEPRISHDGLRLYFASNRTGSDGSYDIFVATRATTLDVFGTPAPVANINSTYAEFDPFLSADETSIYFQSSQPDGLGSSDIYVSALGADGTFGAPQAVPGVNSASADRAPVLTQDGLTMYFGSTRNTGTAYDIFVARRPTLNDAFGTPEVVTELSTADIEWPLDLSADGCTLYFVGTAIAGRPGRGGADLFAATRGR
jgi:hypothetical protein